MHEAKTQLSRLVDRALAGEEIVIAKAGEPKVRLAPVEEPRKPRQLGRARGKIWYAPDWDSDEFNAEIAKLFNESHDPFLEGDED